MNCPICNAVDSLSIEPDYPLSKLVCSACSFATFLPNRVAEGDDLEAPVDDLEADEEAPSVDAGPDDAPVEEPPAEEEAPVDPIDDPARLLEAPDDPSGDPAGDEEEGEDEAGDRKGPTDRSFLPPDEHGPFLWECPPPTSGDYPEPTPPEPDPADEFSEPEPGPDDEEADDFDPTFADPPEGDDDDSDRDSDSDEEAPGPDPDRAEGEEEGEGDADSDSDGDAPDGLEATPEGESSGAGPDAPGEGPAGVEGMAAREDWESTPDLPDGDVPADPSGRPIPGGPVDLEGDVDGEPVDGADPAGGPEGTGDPADDPRAGLFEFGGRDGVKFQPDPDDMPRRPPIDWDYTSLKVQTFYRRIGDVLRDNSFDRTVDGLRRGKLSSRLLYRVGLGGDRVFSQKAERGNKKYNILIVVDESSSMLSQYVDRERGRLTVVTLIDTAADYVRLLVEGFDRHGIDTSVHGYNHYYNIRKEWGRSVDLEELGEAIRGAVGHGGGCNHDWAALREAELSFERLGTDRSSNICLFITDGSVEESKTCEYWDPKTKRRVMACTGGPGLAFVGLGAGTRRDVRLREQVEALEKRAAVIVIGLGDDDVRSYYTTKATKPLIVNSRGEFMAAILTSLSKMFKRG